MIGGCGYWNLYFLDVIGTETIILDQNIGKRLGSTNFPPLMEDAVNSVRNDHQLWMYII
jgi:hypothetical protein